MVLSDRYGGSRRPSIGRKTALYVALFAVGSLVIAVALSFVLVGVAEGMLATAEPTAAVTAGATVNVIEPAARKRAPRSSPGSKARPGRVNPTKTNPRPAE